MKIDALTDLPRRASAIHPPTRLPVCVRRTGRRAGAPGLPTPPQGGSNGGHGEFPPSIDHHAAGWRLPTASAVAWWATTRVAPTNATAWTTTPPPFSPFPLRKGGRGDRSLYRNTSTGFARAARTA